MAVDSVDKLVAGTQPMRFLHKGNRNLNITSNRNFSTWPLPGIPGPGRISTAGIAGEALSQSVSRVKGALPFTDPTGGKTAHVANLALVNGSSNWMMLCDRLWHNNAINPALTSTQTINSVAFPARDAFGSSDGFGVMLGLEDVTDASSGTGTFNITYTNSDGVSGRTASSPSAHVAAARTGFFNICNLAAGDYGVRSVQSIQLSSAIGGASLALVAYRIIAMVDNMGTLAGVMDPVSGGLPELYPGTVPFIMGFNGNAGIFTGRMNVAEG